jgi:hypothetical protein
MGAEMAEARTYYDSEYYKGLTWWFVRDEIGRGLRERYQLPKELPPKLLALVRKLDAIEGNYLLRYAPPLERRSVGESDWLPPRLVWQNDADLFGGRR